MEDGSKQEKSTGYSPPIQTEGESALAQPESTGKKRELPVLTTALLKDESKNSTGILSASKILAIGILLGDYKKVKKELPLSRITSNRGKIYWCIEAKGHDLKILDGNLLVDGNPVDWEKILDT